MLRTALHAVGRGRRVPRTGYAQLNSKIGPREYYKGKGAKSTGSHTSKGINSRARLLFASAYDEEAAFLRAVGNVGRGCARSAGGYKLQKEKLPQYVVPDLTDFKVGHGWIVAFS